MRASSMDKTYSVPMVPELNAAMARVLAALAAAGDAAYVWDIASDQIEWHGSPRMGRMQAARRGRRS